MKKIYTIFITLGILITILGVCLMIILTPGNKISATEFKKTIVKDHCDINFEQTTADENIKTQLISMDYGCPYYITYTKYKNKEYLEQAVETTITSIKEDAKIEQDLKLFDYQDLRTTTDSYNVMIKKDNIVVLATTDKKNKKKLDQAINNMNITYQPKTEYAWISILGIITIFITIIVEKIKKQSQ